MAILHTVNKSPFESASFETCMGLAKSGSTVLLIEDGVFAARANNKAADMVSGASLS